jgi:hypothetical protein
MPIQAYSVLKSELDNQALKSTHSSPHRYKRLYDLKTGGKESSAAALAPEYKLQKQVRLDRL